MLVLAGKVGLGEPLNVGMDHPQVATAGRGGPLAGEFDHLFGCRLVRSDIDALIRDTMLVQERLGHPAVLAGLS